MVVFGDNSSKEVGRPVKKLLSDDDSVSSVKKQSKVTPYEVSGELDYDKLINEFGATKLNEKLLSKLRPIHRAFRRGLFISHRDLDEIIKGKFSIVSGRGPSANMTIAHLLLFDVVKAMQEAFGCFVFIPFSNDEKFMFKQNLEFKQSEEYALDNAADILALGFKPSNTKIMIDTINMNQDVYNLSVKASKRMTNSMVKAVFGFTNESNIGINHYPAIQAAHILYPTLSKGLRVLVPIGIDQDPFVRLSRDIAQKLGYAKPAAMHSRFIRGLSGTAKMSASDPLNAIYTTDSPEEAGHKVMRAFTGGRDTLKEQRELGGRPEFCSVFEYLSLFFKDSDSVIAEQVRGCRAGQNYCGACKKELCEFITDFLVKHKARKEKIKDRINKYYA